jgi:ABC-2 type transport system permease protein
MFLRLIRAELLKLREPSTLVTLVLGPAFIATILLIAAAGFRRGVLWADVLPPPAVLMALFLFPLSATVFIAFAAQIEHRARAWDHLLALPVPKWALFTVKALVVTAATLAMYPLFLVLLLLAGALGSLIARGGLMGPLELEVWGAALALSAASGLMLIAVQLWISLRFSLFVPPVIVGLGGLIVTWMALSLGKVEQTRFLPWGLPYYAHQELVTPWSQGDPLDARLLAQIVAVGVLGGLLALAGMIVHLSRRDMR